MPTKSRPPRAGLEAALSAGAAILEKRERALDAVEAAVRVLEEDPCYNAGRGSVLTMTGCIELDAAIMDGSTRAAGAVAGLRTTRAPMSLARRLLEEGPHVFLSGKGADEFARDHGLEQVPNSWFEIPERRRQLEELLAEGGFDDEIKYGTVGAVAVDVDGHVAVATSTGGLTAKRWGRVGDSPLIGGNVCRRQIGCRFSDRLGRRFVSAPSQPTSWPSECISVGNRCRKLSTPSSRILRALAEWAG